jgi:hypothetical protein
MEKCDLTTILEDVCTDLVKDWNDLTNEERIFVREQVLPIVGVIVNVINRRDQVSSKDNAWLTFLGGV